jgi:hypothetical protein
MWHAVIFQIAQDSNEEKKPFTVFIFGEMLLYNAGNMSETWGELTEEWLDWTPLYVLKEQGELYVLKEQGTRT